jgi:hypothetical protein
MAWADLPPWLGAGRRLPRKLWRGVREVAGCRNIRERPCRIDQVQRIAHEVARVPLAPAIAAVAGVDYFFVASHLQKAGAACYGIAYEGPDRRRWFGLEELVVDGRAREPWLDIPLLRAVFVEELLHVWDYTLEGREPPSPYFSIDRRNRPGPRWRAVECDAAGRPLPFDIPNRKKADTDAEQIAEDWASAVLWYLVRPERLAVLSPDRHAFVENLLSHELTGGGHP